MLNFSVNFSFGNKSAKRSQERSSSLENPSEALLMALGIQGVQVNESGVKVGTGNAESISTVYACVDIRSDAMAMLPKKLYRYTGESREEVKNHPAARLLKNPNTYQTSSTFWKTIYRYRDLNGNGYAYIHRDAGGDPLSMHIIKPTHCTPMEVTDELGNYHIVYHAILPNNKVRLLMPHDVLHLKGMGDGIEGKSIVSWASQTLGLAKAAETFGASFFGNGTNMKTILTTDRMLDKDKRTEYLKSFAEQARSAGQNGTVFIDGGIRAERIGIPPNDAQFLETRQFQVEEICRWFRVPEHLVQSSRKTSYSSGEQDDAKFVKYTLEPLAVAEEQELEMKLLRYDEMEDYDFKNNFNMLLRGDSRARGQYYKDLFFTGAISPNEIRRLEEMNSYEGGDYKFTPQNMISNEQLISELSNPNLDQGTREKVLELLQANPKEDGE
jgi:HK97 family phage portal protein